MTSYSSTFLWFKYYKSEPADKIKKPKIPELSQIVGRGGFYKKTM